MLKKSFRRDIISLKALYTVFRASESFCATEEELNAYAAFDAYLEKLCEKYGKTRRQIAAALNA